MNDTRPADPPEAPPRAFEHRFVIEPHTSTRYAIVFAEALEPGADGYEVCAVHAFADDGCVLVSRVRPHSEAGALAFDPPWWVPRGATIRLCANSKTAWTIRGAMVEEDRLAETRVVAP